MMTNSDVPRAANQLRSGLMPGTQSNQWLTYPDVMSNA
jgi:hypothetical protein